VAAALTVVVLTTTGCPPPSYHPPVVQGDRQCGTTSGWIWRATWWNFYERGQSWAECDLLDEAVEDFQRAIERRDADQRHARTYGMHFVDDYFPHRELGIAFLRQGKLEEAERELKTSLDAQPSARARFYLNEVRRASLRRRGLGALPGPVLELDGAATFATREPNVWISGRARSGQYVGAIEIDGQPQLIELGELEVPFRAAVPVPLGTRTVTVVATDLLGNRSESVISITGDREGPVVAVQDIVVAREREITVSATVQDTAGLAAVEIAGVELVRDSSPLLRIHQRLVRPADGRIPFRAQDLLGNETTGTLVLDAGGGLAELSRATRVAALDSDHAHPSVTVGARARTRLDRADRRSRADSRLPTSALTPAAAASPVLAASSLDEIRWKLGERLDAALDRSPPLLRIDGLADTQTVHQDRILVTGSVSDDAAVQSIRIDQTLAAVENTLDGPVPAERPTIAIAPKRLELTPGKEVFFSTVLPLGEGPNEIRIASTDAAGKTTQRTVQVTRKRAAIHDPNVRLVLAPMPFREGETLSDLSDTLESFLVDGLVEQRRYRIVDRARLLSVLGEHALARSKLVDPDTAVRAGRLAAADAILVGRAYRRGASLEAWVKIVDAETAEDLVIEDSYGEKVGTADVRAIMSTLAQKLALAIPTLETPVIEVDGGRVTIAKGTTDRLKPRFRVALFRPLDGPDTARPAARADSSYESLGRGQILTVEAARARAALDAPTSSANPARAGDLLVIR